MAEDVRRRMEWRLNRDFSDVRIHDDGEAAASAEQLRAAAYTTGSSVVFAAGRHAPQTSAGDRLLTHELAHVVQQREAATIAPQVGAPEDAHERAAERVATAASPAAAAPATPTTVPAIQRQEASASTGPPDKPAGDRATDQEVDAKLTEFLTRVLEAQGGQTLRDSPVISQALHALAQGSISSTLAVDAFLAQPVHPGTPAEYARAARGRLPSSISKADLAKLDRIPSAPSSLDRPASAGEALGRLIVDRTVAPLIRKLPVSKETQAKLIEAARSAVASGAAAVAGAAIKSANLDPQAQAALSAAIEAAIKQKTTSPSAPPAGRDMPPQPAAASPSLPPVPNAVSAPQVPIPDVPGQARPPQLAPVTPPTVGQVIQGIDDQSLIPAAVRGTPPADQLSQAQDFARALAGRLADAQRRKRFTVEMEISNAYRQLDNVADVLDEAERIVRKVAGAALPAQGAAVGEVIVTVAGTQIRRVVRL